LSALIHERELAYVLSLLRAEGIEPVLIKGWAIARLYPDAGLRPYGDIDLCIRPDQFAAASAALKCLEDLDGHYVDLHSGFARIGQTRAGDGTRSLRRFRINAGEMRVWDELFSRSELVPLSKDQSAKSKVQGPKSKVMSEPPALAGGLNSLLSEPPASAGGLNSFLSEPRQVGIATGSQSAPKVQSTKSKVLSPETDFGLWTLDFGQTVRVLSREDHLRILSAHLLRSGARRPPWLCDIALLLDKVQSPRSSAPGGSVFNWDVCLSDRLHDNWVASAVMLARDLLGADISQTPVADRQLPNWLVPAVLRQWGRSRAQSSGSKVQSHVTVQGLQTQDSRLRTNLSGLWTKLDNPVRATAAVGGQFNNWPRLPYRVAELVMRFPEAPAHLASLLQQFAARRSRRSNSELSSPSHAGATRWNASLSPTE
jgi:hypothetical protein